jgi:hypothetical protein
MQLETEAISIGALAKILNNFGSRLHKVSDRAGHHMKHIIVLQR